VVLPTHIVRNPVGPDQLSLLQEVFDQACVEHNISKSSPDGEALALILVNSMQKGVGEKERLESLAHILADSREA